MFCVWHLLFNIMSKNSSLVVCSSPLIFFVHCSIVLQYEVLKFIRSTFGGLLDCFHFLYIKNKTCEYCYTSWCTFTFISIGYVPGNGFSKLLATCVLRFRRYCQSSKVVVPIYTPSVGVAVFWIVLYPQQHLPLLLILLLIFYVSHCGEWEVVLFLFSWWLKKLSTFSCLLNVFGYFFPVNFPICCWWKK